MHEQTSDRNHRILADMRPTCFCLAAAAAGAVFATALVLTLAGALVEDSGKHPGDVEALGSGLNTPGISPHPTNLHPNERRAVSAAGATAAVATDASICSSLGMAVLRGEHRGWSYLVSHGDFFPQFKMNGSRPTNEPLKQRMPEPTTALSSRGNAADAAVAVALCLGVVSPASSGVGGGAVGVFYDRVAGAVACVDGREEAPSGATTDMYNGTGPETSLFGLLSIAVRVFPHLRSTSRCVC
jgi:Gamma-glutamyltranspeptidase